MTAPKLSQKQNEALTDILVLAMCADGHFSLIEEEKIQEKIAGLSWQEDFSLSHFVNLSIAKARDVVDSPEKVKTYLDQRAAQLDDNSAKTDAFEKTVALLNADGLKAEENTFLIQLRASLNV